MPTFESLYVYCAVKNFQSSPSQPDRLRRPTISHLQRHSESPFNMSNANSAIAPDNDTATSTPTLPTPYSLQAPTSTTKIQWQKQFVLMVILVIIQVTFAFAVREIYHWHLRGSRRRRAHQQHEERNLHSSGAADVTGGAIGLVHVVAGSVV